MRHNCPQAFHIEGTKLEKLLLKTHEAAEILGIGRTLLYRIEKEGQIGPCPIKLGSCTVWNYSELKRWVEAGCPGREKWVAAEKLK